MARSSVDWAQLESATHVVLELRSSGHRLDFVRHVLEHATSSERVVWVTSRQAMHSREYAMRDLSKFVSCTLAIDVSEPDTVLATREVLDELCRLPGNWRIILPDGDKLIGRLAFLSGRRHRVTALLIRRPLLSIRIRQFYVSLVKGLLSILVQLRGHRVLGLTPARLAVPENAWAKARPKKRLPFTIEPVSDPIDLAWEGDRAAARAMLGIDTNRTLVVLAGNITLRKNPQVVMAALLGIGGSSPPGLLLVGRLDPAVEASCFSQMDRLRRAGRLWELPGPLSGQRLDAGIGAGDCVVVAHSTLGPSGIVGRSVALGVPVVVAGPVSLSPDIEKICHRARLDAVSLKTAISEVLGAASHAPRQLESAASFAAQLLAQRA